MKTSNAAEPGTFTGRHMLFVMFAFFGTIIAVNITMAVFSATSWTGLVVTNSYVASQEFETKRLAHLQQQAAGWEPSFVFAGGVATLTIRDGAGAPVDLGKVTVKLNRPVGGHDDQQLELTRGPDGSYAVAATLGTGVWDAWVEAPETALGPFELHERFKLEETGK